MVPALPRRRVWWRIFEAPYGRGAARPAAALPTPARQQAAPVAAPLRLSPSFVVPYVSTRRARHRRGAGTRSGDGGACAVPACRALRFAALMMLWHRGPSRGHQPSSVQHTRESVHAGEADRILFPFSEDIRPGNGGQETHLSNAGYARDGASISITDRPEACIMALPNPGSNDTPFSESARPVSLFRDCCFDCLCIPLVCWR